MVHYKFNQAEIRNLWKRCKNKRYDVKSFKNRGSYVKYIIFGDKQSDGHATGKVVTRFTEGEVYHWPRLRHRSLAPLLDVVYIDERIAVYMSSYLPQTLRELIHDENFINDPQCFDRKKSFIEDVLWGLNYLHSKHLCLMNISDVNVFVTQAENKAVIANFTCLSMFHNAYKHKRCAPLMYRAPELTTPNTIFDPIPTDIWSVGVMVMEVFLNHMCPWGSVDYDSNRALDLSTKIDYEMLKIANRGFILTSNDVLDLKRFLSMFLDLNPKNRCSAKEAALKKFIQSTTCRIHIRKKKMFKLGDSAGCKKITLSCDNVSSPCQLKNKRSLSETDLRHQSNLQISIPEVETNGKHLSRKKIYSERQLDNPHSEIRNSKFKSSDLKKFTELANTSKFEKNMNRTSELYNENHKSLSETLTRDKTFFQLSNPKELENSLEHQIELGKVNLKMNKPSEIIEDNKHEQANREAAKLKLKSDTSSQENVRLRESFSDSKLMLTTENSLSNIFTAVQMSAPCHCPLTFTKNKTFYKIRETRNNHQKPLESPESPDKQITVVHPMENAMNESKGNAFDITTPDEVNNRSNDKETNILQSGDTDENLYPQDANELEITNDAWNAVAWQNNIMASVKHSDPNHKQNNHWDELNKMQISDAYPRKKIVLYTTGSQRCVNKEIPNLNASPFTGIKSKDINNIGRNNITELTFLNNKNLNVSSNTRDKHNRETISSVDCLSENAWLSKHKPSHPKGGILTKAVSDLGSPLEPKTSNLAVCDFHRNRNQEVIKSGNKTAFAEVSPTDSETGFEDDFSERAPEKQLKVKRRKAKCSHRRGSRKSGKRNAATVTDNRDKLSSKQKCQMSKFLLSNVNEDLNEDDKEFETESIPDLYNESAVLKSLKEKATKSGANCANHKNRKLKKFLCFG